MGFKIRVKIFIQLIFILSIPLFFLSNIHADAFKCGDKAGNIVFQDSACTDDEKETLIDIQKKVVSVDNIFNIQCKARCDNRRGACVTRLGEGARNTGENLLRCEKAKEACYLRCANADIGGKLAKTKAKWKRVQEQAKGWTPREEAYYRRRIEDAEDIAIIECK